MKRILLFCIISLSACDVNKDTNHIVVEGIKFETTEVERWESIGLPLEQAKNIIQTMKKFDKSEDEIKEHLSFIRSWGVDPLDMIENINQNVVNDLYTACYNNYSNRITTFKEREATVAFCECLSKCYADNIKFSNLLPTSLSEQDEKDAGKVELAQIKLEKACGNKCIASARKQVSK